MTKYRLHKKIDENDQHERDVVFLVNGEGAQIVFFADGILDNESVTCMMDEFDDDGYGGLILHSGEIHDIDTARLIWKHLSIRGFIRIK